MNLLALLNRGAAHAPKPPAYPPSVVKAAEQARAQWLNALLVDQTRAWMDLGAEQPDVLSGLAVAEMCMADLGWPVKLGSGVAAAQEYYRGTAA